MDNDVQVIEQHSRDTTPKYVLTVPGVAAVLSDCEGGSSIQRCADTYGVSYQAVRQFIERNADRLLCLKSGDKLLSYKLQDAVHRIIDSIQEKDFEKSNLQSKMVSIGIAIDKSRLLEGKVNSIQQAPTISLVIKSVNSQILASITTTTTPVSDQE